MAVCCALASTSAALAQLRDRYLLIDRDLRADTVDLVSIRDGWVECLRSGLIDRRPVGDLLGIMRLDEHDGVADFAAGDRCVELVDGQLWYGAHEPSPLPEHLGWRIDRIGVLSAPLEDVLRARLVEGARLPVLEPQATEERLLLANGDAMSGLLVSIGQQVEFEATGSSEVLRLPVHQVASLALLNLPQRPSGTMVWLEDGSVLRVTDVQWSPASMQFTTAADSMRCSVESGMLRGLSFAAERVVPLADLSPEVVRESSSLKVVEAPVVLNAERAIGLSDVQLRGPIDAVYTLPDGATRFHATVVVPRFAADWAELDVVVLLDGRIVLETGMDGTGRSRREIDLSVAGARTMTLRLGEGQRGPIQDVIVLQRPMLLFD